MPNTMAETGLGPASWTKKRYSNASFVHQFVIFPRMTIYRALIITPAAAKIRIR